MWSAGAVCVHIVTGKPLIKVSTTRFVPDMRHQQLAARQGWCGLEVEPSLSRHNDEQTCHCQMDGQTLRDVGS